MIRPKILQQQTDHAVIDAILTEAMPKVFGYLESQSTDGYLVGNRFSIADIALACNLINFHYLGYRIDAARYPKLERNFKRLCPHPSIASAAHGAAGGKVGSARNHGSRCRESSDSLAARV